MQELCDVAYVQQDLNSGSPRAQEAIPQLPEAVV